MVRRGLRAIHMKGNLPRASHFGNAFNRHQIARLVIHPNERDNRGIVSDRGFNHFRGNHALTIWGNKGGFIPLFHQRLHRLQRGFMLHR